MPSCSLRLQSTARAAGSSGVHCLVRASSTGGRGHEDRDTTVSRSLAQHPPAAPTFLRAKDPQAVTRQPAGLGPRALCTCCPRAGATNLLCPPRGAALATALHRPSLPSPAPPRRLRFPLPPEGLCHQGGDAAPPCPPSSRSPGPGPGPAGTGPCPLLPHHCPRHRRPPGAAACPSSRARAPQPPAHAHAHMGLETGVQGDDSRIRCFKIHENQKKQTQKIHENLCS